MGLFNMEEAWLIKLISTNIQWVAVLCFGEKMKITGVYSGIARAF